MAQSEITTRIGVGLKPLQGLLTCGQLEMTQSTSVDDGHLAGWLDGHIHEEVDIGHNVPLAHAVLGDFEHEIVAAGVQVPGVMAEAHGVALAGAGAG
jgi:hypothetical protein